MLSIGDAFGLFIRFLVPVGNAVLAVCDAPHCYPRQDGINPMYLSSGLYIKCIFFCPWTYSHGQHLTTAIE